MTALILGFAGLLVFSLFSRPMHRISFSSPLFFILLGILLSFTSMVHWEADESVVLLAEMTLAIVLFNDATLIKLDTIRQSLPYRALFIGLPLAIGFNFLIIYWVFPHWSWADIGLLATLLAPTDLALSQSLVNSATLTTRTKKTLITEGGLNDGFSLPLVLFFGCFAVQGIHDSVQSDWFQFLAEQLGLGVLVGVVIGVAGAAALKFTERHKLSTHDTARFASIALTALTYLIADLVGGNALVACFCAGVGFSLTLKRKLKPYMEFSEQTGMAMTFACFLLLGLLYIPAALAEISLPAVLIIAAVLLVTRPVAIVIAMSFSDTSWATRWFLGWFGPRGLATALFTLVAFHLFPTLPYKAEIAVICYSCVLVSAVLHGFTARPLTLWYARLERTQSKGS